MKVMKSTGYQQYINKNRVVDKKGAESNTVDRLF